MYKHRFTKSILHSFLISSLPYKTFAKQMDSTAHSVYVLANTYMHKQGCKSRVEYMAKHIRVLSLRIKHLEAGK